MIGKVTVATDGMKGFDANFTLSPEAAAAFKTTGYDFAIRYVRRSVRHAFDLSITEVKNILAAGLGLMVVQHVAPPGWVPSKTLGYYYGNTAATECSSLRLPTSTMLWCDLEGVITGIDTQEVIDFCNAWQSQVSAAGFTPGLYVGDSPGISASDLYAKLNVQHYWSAYNLNADQYPAVRGVQMKQRAAQPADLVPGVDTQFDVDTIAPDASGGLPILLVAL